MRKNLVSVHFLKKFPLQINLCQTEKPSVRPLMEGILFIN